MIEMDSLDIEKNSFYSLSVQMWNLYHMKNSINTKKTYLDIQIDCLDHQIDCSDHKKDHLDSLHNKTDCLD